MIVNHDIGEVVWVHNGHGKSVFELFFQQLTPEQANSESLRLAAENTQLHEALDKSLQEEAKAQASLQSMKRLLPFLDPKHLDKVCVG